MVRGLRKSVLRVLDLDMDLFQTERVSRPRNQGRADADPRFSGVRPLPPEEVEAFLVRCCQANENSRISAIYVEHHAEVFDYLHLLFQSGLAEAPLILVHADAHADLGCGDLGWKKVLTELLHLPIEARMAPSKVHDPVSPDPYGVDDGNYLLFALACRWLRGLTYVHHPACFDDLPRFIFPDNVPCSGSFRLCAVDRNALDRGARVATLVQAGAASSAEPAVDFSRVDMRTFTSREPFDLAFVARSPSYTVETIDNLYGIVQDFLPPVSI